MQEPPSTKPAPVGIPIRPSKDGAQDLEYGQGSSPAERTNLAGVEDAAIAHNFPCHEL
jgi:hypothetical protein